MNDISRTDPLPDAEIAYLARIVETLTGCLDEELVGVYLFGSAAYGAYRPGLSDLDVQAVTRGTTAKPKREAIARTLSHRMLPCPARRLEFVCYPQGAIDPMTRHPRFELNLNTGAGETDQVTFNADDEPGHWFLLDIASGRELGQSLFGPPPATIFGPVPRLWVLEAIAESLAWHEKDEAGSASAIMNACRGWCFAATGWWCSKQEGVDWVREKQPAEQQRNRIIEHAGNAVRTAIAHEKAEAPD